ncbi:MAG: acyl-CoA thioesterase [Prevotellaceae bacterium]|jgi:acyl-CoA thioester hydrolase|nr:acyl-CoA thioesterase [Prevotellaceae bacterium]
MNSEQHTLSSEQQTTNSGRSAHHRAPCTVNRAPCTAVHRAPLSATTPVEIHFYDVDSLGIVWHGRYLKYLEEGREAFGRKFGVAYTDIYNSGYIAPIVDLHIRYLDMVALNESLEVETAYVPTGAAKLIFDYTIRKQSGHTVVARAASTQVFVTREGVMEVSTPEFYRKWKEKWGVQEN